MESSFIELTVISCKHLKSFNFFQKLSIYALVSIASDDDKKVEGKQLQRTPTDREGDGNPEWNHMVRFEVSEALLRDRDNVFIHFDLRHEGAMFGDKTIGEVHVPFMDLIQESNGIVRFVTYEVRTPDGKSNGVLNFSFKVNGKDLGLRTAATDSPAIQIAGYPLVHHHHHQSPEGEAQFSSSEVHGKSSKVQYPVLELENLFQGPQLPSSSSGNQDLVQETYFQPQNVYHPLPPVPPMPVPPPLPYPPPPPTTAHGPFYHLPPPPPPPPPGPNPWGPNPYVGAYGYCTHGSHLGSAQRRLETWPNGWQGGGNHHSSSWNGR